MQISTGYKNILKLSGPIMLGSAVQSIITMTDSVFLYHLSEEDFATIGIVSVFYMMIAAIGYNFSKGGQIMIARRSGESNPTKIGEIFQAMLFSEIVLAIALFIILQFAGYYLLASVIDSDVIFYKSLDYLSYRAYGVFFSFIGLSIISFYTGVARTMFIIVDSIILAIVNVIFNYGLIFGNLGMPEMGIAGAGLASTIAEAVAMLIFVIYILVDKKVKPFRLFSLPKKIDFASIFTQYKISAPVVVQAVIGFGSWFVFFGIIENLGQRSLEITNLVRMVFLALSIPTWGFASGANTMVSNLIGNNNRRAIIPVLWRISKFCLLWTIALTLPVLLFPEHILYPLFGKEDMSLIVEAMPIFYVMSIILIMFCVSAIFFNGLAATGGTHYGLAIQAIAVVVYLAFVYISVEVVEAGLVWAWTAEIYYWVLIFIFSLLFLRSSIWYKLKI